MIGQFPAAQPVDRDSFVEIGMECLGVVASIHVPCAGQGPEVTAKRLQACGALLGDILDETVECTDTDSGAGSSGLGRDEQQAEFVPGLEARRDLAPRRRHLLTRRMIVVENRAFSIQYRAAARKRGSARVAEPQHDALIALIRVVAGYGNPDGLGLGADRKRQSPSGQSLVVDG